MNEQPKMNDVDEFAFLMEAVKRTSAEVLEKEHALRMAKHYLSMAEGEAYAEGLPGKDAAARKGILYLNTSLQHIDVQQEEFYLASAKVDRELVELTLKHYMAKLRRGNDYQDMQDM